MIVWDDNKSRMSFSNLIGESRLVKVNFLAWIPAKAGMTDLGNYEV